MIELIKKLFPLIDFLEISLIEDGWSYDQKYKLVNQNNDKYIFRISDIASYQRKMTFYPHLLELKSMPFKASKVLEIKMIDDKSFYTLLSWVEGVDAKDKIKTFPADKQFSIGYQAGKTLKQIHSIKAPDHIIKWNDRYNKKIDYLVQKAFDCKDLITNYEKIVAFINDNRFLLDGRKQVFQHGDFHIGNMVIDENDEIGIIDFDRADYGDPFEDLKTIYWNVYYAGSEFTSGLINGYFEGDVPESFFKLLSLYVATGLIAWMPWANSYGNQEVELAKEGIKETLSWYNDFNSFIPNWYKGSIK